VRQLLDQIARALIPEFDSLSVADRLRVLRELFGTLYFLPFLFIGIGWLIAVTDWTLVREQWPFLLLLLVLSIVAERLSYFQFSLRIRGDYTYNASNLAIVITISAWLIFGPTAIWLMVISRLLTYLSNWPHAASDSRRWNWIRNLVFNLGAEVITLLIAAAIYVLLGGEYPLSQLTFEAVWPAIVSVLIYLPLGGLLLVSMSYLYVVFDLVPPIPDGMRWMQAKETFFFFLVAQAPGLFGILAALIYSQMGVVSYLGSLAAVLLTSLLARRLSQQALVSQQRSREMTHLEELGRSIINSPAEVSVLPELLFSHFPGTFGYRQAEIRLFPEHILLQLPEGIPPLSEQIWTWLKEHPRPAYFAPGDNLPWTGEETEFPIFTTPILTSEPGEDDNALLGGICLVQDSLFSNEISVDVLPALQVLAAQIASAIARVEATKQAIAHERVEQELAFAGRIQTSLLPDVLPEIKGWDIAATLRPTRETAGDFYDLVELPNGNLGLVIADVTDKGMGAALFMAMSRTLLRSYAFTYQDHPTRVLEGVNQRILADTHNDLFVTVFYGVLNPASGAVTYANAGHNPPLLVKDHSAMEAQASITRLWNTGIPLGILEEQSWDSKTLTLGRDDLLLLYTDGITDAHNAQEELFGEERLIDTVAACRGAPAASLQENILSEVDLFAGDVPQFDDLTLMILMPTKREVAFVPKE
jgi:serine phosphatase RsbU (regulator of sigma subunit)